MASTIAYLRQQIAAEYQAAQHGLSGLRSGTSRHDFIQARMAKIGEYQEQLTTILGNEQAATDLVIETLESMQASS